MKKVRKSPKKTNTSTAKTSADAKKTNTSNRGASEPSGSIDFLSGSSSSSGPTSTFFSFPPPPVLTKDSSIIDYIKYGFLYINQQVYFLNNSKIFAGLIVITLNIAGKFVNFKLSKTMESYLKHTFSRNLLVFCIAWMGSREIYVAILITLLCILIMDFVCNENSGYCMLPETFITYHTNVLENSAPTKEEINNAKDVLKRAEVTGVPDSR
jgi:hypothetical protein